MTAEIAVLNRTAVALAAGRGVDVHERSRQGHDIGCELTANKEEQIKCGSGTIKLLISI